MKTLSRDYSKRDITTKDLISFNKPSASKSLNSFTVKEIEQLTKSLKGKLQSLLI